MTVSTGPVLDDSRLSTGIPRFDALLHGGLLVGGVYMFVGTPGSGKTIMTNQIAYAYATNGNRVTHITVLGETHSRMIGYLRQFQFFDETLIGNQLFYYSGYEKLRSEGLAGLGMLISSTLIQERPGLIVLDGVPIDVQTAGSPNNLEMNDFLHGLQAMCETARCTVLITTPSTARMWDSHAFLFVDGVIELQRSVFNAVESRTLEVRKFRGSPYRAASQPFTITQVGITSLA